MIQRFSFGKMIPTDSVVLDLPVQAGPVPYLTGDAAGWQYTLAKEDIVYGLGETTRGINKRGWHYTSYCSDDPGNTENKMALYGAHNFFVVAGPDALFGVFVDFGGKIDYDMGYADPDTLTITPAAPDYDLYILTGGSVLEIVKELRGLVGRSYIPPRWAFGFGQSRWSYATADAVRAVADGYRKNDIPLDMIYLDIDYMKDFIDFTVDPGRFPDLPGLVEEMKAQGIRLVPIIDAGVKMEPGDPTYDEGLEKGYFCKEADGSLFVGAVWPGKACFPDFLRPEVRRWFGEKYQILLDMGIEGFWNDMNEPAIFYSEKGLAKAFADIRALSEKENLGIYDFFGLKDAVAGIANSPADYKSFYHQVGDKTVCHDDIHNLFGYNMTRAAGETFESLRPGKRTLMYSRASCIGAHRYGGIWLGDNCAWWAHLLQNIQQLPSVQMCGFLFAGADLGGFSCDTTEELITRWTQFGIFTPLMRNHAAMGTREQELYQFEKSIPTLRELVRLRYALLPYIYSEYVKAALTGGMYARPLAFDFPADEQAKRVEDQLLLGESLMVAPIYTQNGKGRYVYLPEGMKLLRIRSLEDYDEQILPAGHHWVDCGLNELLLFIRPGKLVPLAKPARSTMDMDFAVDQVWNFGAAEYKLYSDDGETTDYENPAHWTTVTAAE